jgi:hypothetical protein
MSGTILSAEPPNALPISRRKRTAETCQNANDLAREAVGCMGVFGGNVSCPALIQ